MTDEWRSYRRLQRLNRHRAVNHGLHFVDPTDPAVHTQTIENKNGQLKDMIRRRHDVADQILPSLLKFSTGENTSDSETWFSTTFGTK
uniref:ISXO2-like transposase domain-containing protein n=1 Tax=Acrobeloides nanus TaxID=290746 RepID=A0A914DUE4_9BILA